MLADKNRYRSIYEFIFSHFNFGDDYMFTFYPNVFLCLGSIMLLIILILELSSALWNMEARFPY